MEAIFTRENGIWIKSSRVMAQKEVVIVKSDDLPKSGQVSPSRAIVYLDVLGYSARDTRSAEQVR